MGEAPSNPLDRQRTSPVEPTVLLEGWLHTFLNRVRPYALQQADGAYRWVYEDCTPALVAAHLAGELTLALSSTDARGWCRWACLDVDVPGTLPQLLTVRAALAELSLLGLVEGSRRGGHLWLVFDEPVPATAARYTIGEALAAAYEAGVEVPTYELYPDTGAPGALGHAVRLPLGIHRKTGTRYPLYDAEGLPCVFSSPAKAAAYLLDATPRAPVAFARARWAAFIADGGARGRPSMPLGPLGPSGDRSTTTRPADRAERARPRREASTVPTVGGKHVGTVGMVGRVGTRSARIRWVDAHVSPLDLLAAFAPQSDVRRVGRGYRGWCPLHEDRAPDAQGLPGTPSLYLVHDRRYSWSWRCLSSNCAFSAGPMKHSFRLFQELRGLSAAAALAEVCERWPEAEGNSGAVGYATQDTQGSQGRGEAGSKTEEEDGSDAARGDDEEDEEAERDGRRDQERRSGDDDRAGGAATGAAGRTGRTGGRTEGA